MGVLQRFERRVEGMVEGAFAKMFRGEVQPVEVAAALQRECDDKRAVVSQGRVLVPNDFVVELGDHDYARLSPYAGALGDELAQMVREHAQESSYTFVGPVRVAFEQTDDLDTGTFRIRSGVAAGARVHGGVVEQGGRSPATSEAAAADPPVNARRGAPHLVVSRGEYADRDSVEGRGAEEAYFLTRTVTVIGRGQDADVKIDDPRVSRRHAEIREEDGAYVLVDLGSTNGTLVDDAPVDRRQLADGDRIGIGTSTLIFRYDDEQ